MLTVLGSHHVRFPQSKEEKAFSFSATLIFKAKRLPESSLLVLAMATRFCVECLQIAIGYPAEGADLQQPLYSKIPDAELGTVLAGFLEQAGLRFQIAHHSISCPFTLCGKA